MDFTFTEDQQALRDSVSRFLMVEAVPEKLRKPAPAVPPSCAPNWLSRA